MERIATQPELDQLEKFFACRYQPYHDSDPWFLSDRDIIIRKGERVINESATIEVEGEVVEDAFLPEDTIRSIKYPERHPGWLKEQTRDINYKITIKAEDIKATYGEYFIWCNVSSIKSEKPIKILATIISSSDDVKVYYVDSPEDCYDVTDVIFTKTVYYDDGDSYDTQKYYFMQDVDRDLQRLKETFNLEDLFNGMIVANVFPQDIKEILVEDKNIIVKLKDGKERVLNIEQPQSNTWKS